MKDYRVSEVRYGEGEGGIACGPVDGPIIAEAKFTDSEGKAFYLILAEVYGIPNVYKTEESTFEKQINESEDEEFWDELNAKYFLQTGEYDEIFETKDPEYYEALRFLIYLVRESVDDLDEFEGRWLSEIDIPASDVEEEYSEE